MKKAKRDYIKPKIKSSKVSTISFYAGDSLNGSADTSEFRLAIIPPST